MITLYDADERWRAWIETLLGRRGRETPAPPGWRAAGRASPRAAWTAKERWSLEPLAGPGEEVWSTGEWASVERLAPQAECTVAVLEWVEEDPAFPLLCAFKARLPFRPVVLITRKDPHNARWLAERKERGSPKSSVAVSNSACSAEVLY